MIGISDTAMVEQMKFAVMDQAAWEVEAGKLEAQGYRCYGRKSRSPKFVKGTETLILVRNLGRINWHTRSAFDFEQ
jgi:hypothetical protein